MSGPGEARPPRGRRLPRDARLSDGREIGRVVRSGRLIRSGPIHVFVAPSPRDRPRVAIVVPRFGQSAVRRNRLLRRLREIARLDWLPTALEKDRPLDLVLKARAAAYDIGFTELRTSLRSTFESL